MAFAGLVFGELKRNINLFFSLQGPKAFQRHFAEWRHAHGKYLMKPIKVALSVIRDALPRNPQHCPLRKCHPDRGRHGSLGKTQNTKVR